MIKKEDKYRFEFGKNWENYINKVPLNISNSYTCEDVAKSFKINELYMKNYFHKFISFSEDTVFGFESLINSLKLNK